MYNRSPSTPGLRLHFSWWEWTVRQCPLQWNIQTGGWTQLILRRKYNCFCLSFLYVKWSCANQDCSCDWSFPLHILLFLPVSSCMISILFTYLLYISVLLFFLISSLFCFIVTFLSSILIIICIIVSLVLCDDLDGWDRGRWEECSRVRGYLYTYGLFSFFF